MTNADPYGQALDEFEGGIERLTGIPQTARPPEWRAKLITEEAIEADEAIRDTDPYTHQPRDLAHVAKELADLVYVAFGTARRFDIPLHRVFAAVHRSNMTKLDGALMFNSAGKLIKSSAHASPLQEIREILRGTDN